MNRAVFFDRDGTLMEEVHYCADPDSALVGRFWIMNVRSLESGSFPTRMSW